MPSRKHSEREIAKREAALAAIAEQRKDGTLVVRRLTKAERAALDAAAERRRVHAPEMVDVEAER